MVQLSPFSQLYVIAKLNFLLYNGILHHFTGENQIMRISIEEKQSRVARYRVGESVSDICADSGVPRSTFYTWIKPYTVTMTGSGHAISQQAFIKMKQKLQKLEQKKPTENENFRFRIEPFSFLHSNFLSFTSWHPIVAKEDKS